MDVLAGAQINARGVSVNSRRQAGASGRTVPVVAPAEGRAAVGDEDGEPLRRARADMVATARCFEPYGGATEKVHGETIPFLPGHFAATERVPHGVTAHTVPWNHPARMSVLPFGGVKKSGHGRGKGFAALRDASAPRTATVKHA